MGRAGTTMGQISHPWPIVVPCCPIMKFEEAPFNLGVLVPSDDFLVPICPTKIRPLATSGGRWTFSTPYLSHEIFLVYGASDAPYISILVPYLSHSPQTWMAHFPMGNNGTRRAKERDKYESCCPTLALLVPFFFILVPPRPSYREKLK